jgi:single-strand DNA-binding protein
VAYSSINRVVLVGRLTRDPELRALPSGMAACDLRVACNSIRKGQDGDYEEKPNFFSVNVYGAQAEAVGRYMAKGRRLAIDGRLEWREWDTSEGERREAVQVVAERVEFLEGPDREDEGRPAGGADPAEPGDLAATGASLDGDLVF